MILGAFILGPLSAYLLKLFDNLVAGKVKAGLRDADRQLQLGILGGVMAIFGYTVIGPSSAGSPTSARATAWRPWSTTACSRSRR